MCTYMKLTHLHNMANDTYFTLVAKIYITIGMYVCYVCMLCTCAMYVCYVHMLCTYVCTYAM